MVARPGEIKGGYRFQGLSRPNPPDRLPAVVLRRVDETQRNFYCRLMATSRSLRIFVDIQLPPPALALLRERTAGHHLIFARQPAPSILAAAPGGDPAFAAADVVFGQPDPADVLASERLRWMHVSSSGISRYDTPEFRAALAHRKIAFTHSPSVYAEPCADHLLSFMLAQSRLLPRALASRAPAGSPEWLELRENSVPLCGSHAVIVGFGAIGRRVVELLKPWHVAIVAYRRRPRGDEGVPVVTAARLDAVLGAADHVINILPDSSETRGFFGAARFNAIKPGAVFYNIGRGTTVDQDALLAALRSGRLRAAWLDVTEPEPLPDDHPLRAEPNCFITPHVAGGHAREYESLVRHFLANLHRFLAEEPLLDRVV